MKFVILDRDGVINRDSDQYIKSADEWISIEGSIQAIVNLNQSGFKVAVATNQSGLGRNLFDYKTLDSMHEKMCNEVAAKGGKIEKIVFCPHTPEDNCNCRKPSGGLVKQLEEYFGQSLNGAPFVGDTIKDIKEAQISGCFPILVRTGKGRVTEKTEGIDPNIPVFDNLIEASNYIIKQFG